MKKVGIFWITFLITLVILGFACYYVWINMGLSQAVNEKTLGITYDDFIYDEKIQRLELQMNKTYEGGKFFDKYTEYTDREIINSIERKITITVDNSTNEIEEISIHYDIDSNEDLMSAQLGTSLIAKFFSSTIDVSLTEDSNINITDMILSSREFGDMDSLTLNGIEYSVGIIDGYAFVIKPEK